MKWSDLPIWIFLIFVGWMVGSVALALILETATVQKFRSNRIRCPHGMRGGLTRKLCDTCKDELLVAEQQRQSAKQAEELQKRLNLCADQIEQQEVDRLKKSMVPNLEELRRLTPQRFEDEMAQMFKRLGYTVKQTPYSGDGGRDAIMHKEREILIGMQKVRRQHGFWSSRFTKISLRSDDRRREGRIFRYNRGILPRCDQICRQRPARTRR